MFQSVFFLCFILTLLEMSVFVCVLFCETTLSTKKCGFALGAWGE